MCCKAFATVGAEKEKLQARIDRLTLKGQDAEVAFEDAPKRFLANESLQSFVDRRKKS